MARTGSPHFSGRSFKQTSRCSAKCARCFVFVSTIGSIAVTDALEHRRRVRRCEHTAGRCHVGTVRQRERVSRMAPRARSAEHLCPRRRFRRHRTGCLADEWSSRIDTVPSTIESSSAVQPDRRAVHGVAPSINFRSLVPGLSAGAFGGWAWSEQTARGGAFVSLRRANTIFGARSRTRARINQRLCAAVCRRSGARGPLRLAGQL